MAHSVSSDSDDDLPALMDVSDSDRDCDPGLDATCDWFSAVDEDKYPFNQSSCSSSWDFDEVIEDTAAVSITQSAESLLHAELFDSGCMTPYRDELENFKEIPLKLFCVANKQDFTAVGTGEMVVEVPNSVDVSELKLTEVLYCPDVGYTLISIWPLGRMWIPVQVQQQKMHNFRSRRRENGRNREIITRALPEHKRHWRGKCCYRNTHIGPVSLANGPYLL